MAAQYRVARDTLRRAMNVLENRGAVTRRRGRGTFLMPIQPKARSARGATIGFVLPWWAQSVHEWYVANVFDGASAWASEHECHLSMLKVPRRADDEHKLLKTVADRNLDGLVWMHAVPEQVGLLTALSRHLPCVVIGREYPDHELHAVVPDYQQAAILIDRHLVGKGHRIYSVVGRSPADPYGEIWLEGVDEAHRARGSQFDFSAYYVNITPFDRDRMADLLLDFHLTFTKDSAALVLTSSSYLIPLVASERFREKVPRELSVVAFDYGAQAMGTYWPGRCVTHVRCAWDAIGKRAMDVLFQLLESKDAPRVIREPVEFVDGDTVAPRRQEAGLS